jgi:cathepsin A (carboxypeptidase C)
MNTNWGEAGGTKKDRFRKCAGRAESTYKTLQMPPSLPYASYIRAGRLTYTRVFKAGHMINQNKPREAKHMFENWILNRPSFQECDPGP